MRITPETFIKVTLIAILGGALVRMVASRLNVPGLSGLVA